MAETTSGDFSTKHPRATIGVGLTTAFEIFAGLINDSLYREATIAIIPIAVFLLGILGKNLLKEWNCKRGEKYYLGLIDQLKIDLSNSGNNKEKGEIKREIAKHFKSLNELRESNIKIISE